MQNEAREQEMHDEGETRAEQEMHVDVAGEAAFDRVAVVCGMTYGDVVRACFAFNREILGLTIVVDRSDATDISDTSYESKPITVRMHRVDLIDETNYTRLDGDELRTIRPIKYRDGGQRKGWQTCYGPMQTKNGRHKR